LISSRPLLFWSIGSSAGLSRCSELSIARICSTGSDGGSGWVHLLSGDPNGSFFSKPSVVAAFLGDGDIFRIIFAKDAFVDIEITWG